MLARLDLLGQVSALLRGNPVVRFLGPRQSGKTTLAGQILKTQRGERFDILEDPRDVQRLSEPMTALEGLRGLVVIDEVQRRPDLFPILRVLADCRDHPPHASWSWAAPHLTSFDRVPRRWRGAFGSSSSAVSRWARSVPRIRDGCGRAVGFLVPTWHAATPTASVGARISSGPSWSATSTSWASE